MDTYRQALRDKETQDMKLERFNKSPKTHNPNDDIYSVFWEETSGITNTPNVLSQSFKANEFGKASQFFMDLKLNFKVPCSFVSFSRSITQNEYTREESTITVLQDEYFPEDDELGVSLLPVG